MVNRQTRDPGELRTFDQYARIGDAPSYAVDSGEAWRALSSVAGQLSGRLGKMADDAAAREGALAGLEAGAASGAAYLQMQAAQTAAAGKAGPVGKLSPAVEAAITAAAAKYGVSASALRTTAQLESGGDPNAKNPSSSAGGLFQFIDGTARAYGLANRFDIDQSADAAARLMRDNTGRLRKVLGRDPTDAELYLAHQQGGGGAAKLLANPGGDAASTVGADAVRLNGGKAGMTNAEFAGIWLKKAGGAAVPSASPAGSQATVPVVPVLSTSPLALRRDGTIFGEAYDRSAASATAWRMQAGLETQMQAAYEANREDPAALAGALAEVHSNFAQDPNLNDPELAEAFQKRFVDRSQAYLLDARAKATANMREEETVAAYEGIAAQRLGIERQAVALGASAEGDDIMSREVERAGRAIDGAVRLGTLTPAQGAKAKNDLAETAATGRVRGVYEALNSPEKKEQFANGLLDEWTAGKGPLAKLPYDTVKNLSATLWNDARAETNRKTAAQKVDAARTEQLVNDDIASVEATGKGLDPKENDLSADKVGALLGPAKLEEWRTKRALAERGWQATAGMETDTAAEIQSRLTVLAPKAGEPGYASAEKIFDVARKKATAILKARTDDPAAAAQSAFPEVAALATAADPQNPDSMQALISARLQAQKVLGLDDLAAAPLTLSEATSLARAVTAQPDPGKQAQAMSSLVEQVQSAYGPHANAVLTQVLHVRGVDKEMAGYGAGLYARLNRGGAPTTGDRRRGGVLDETGAADRAGEARPDDAFPLPNYHQQQMLIHSPHLAPRFDEKFGPGAAARLLGAGSGEEKPADAPHLPVNKGNFR